MGNNSQNKDKEGYLKDAFFKIKREIESLKGEVSSLKRGEAMEKKANNRTNRAGWELSCRVSP